MNIFFKEIQSSFSLLDKKITKQSSFMVALDYMLKIADESKHQTEKCCIDVDENGDIVIILTFKNASLQIIATSHISYTGKGPKKEDNIRIINSDSYSISSAVFDWIKRNKN